MDIDKVGIWNRSGFESRLDGFTLTLLDSDHKEVFRVEAVASPQVVEIDVKSGKSTYLTYAGKPGSPTSSGSKVASGSWQTFSA